MAIGLLIKNGELHSPHPMGRMDLLCLHGKITAIGICQEKELRAQGIDLEIIDASNCLVIPGLIDPHEHLIGGSGEAGFAARTPEISLSEIVMGGITTVVGCLGTDTYSRNMPALLGQAKCFNEEGITAYIYSGGYPIPPATLTGSIQTDMMMIYEVIGAGETALSDDRGSQASTGEIAKHVAQAFVGGLLSGKCGVTHFHMGEGKKNLSQVRELLDHHDIEAKCIYPTHVNRDDQLLREAAELSHRGVTVDIDVYDQNLTVTLSKFVELDGRLDHVTLSTDASVPSPSTLFQEMRRVMKELKWPLEKILPLATINTARVLKLPHKGRLIIGADADVVIINKQTMDIRDVIARGKVFVKDGQLIYQPTSLKNSNRKIELYGQKTTR